MQQSNIGTIKIIKTHKLLDNTLPKYAKTKPWKRIEPSKRHIQETKH